MGTTVAYHVDGYGPARPAINVKLYAVGRDYWPAAFDGLDMIGDKSTDYFVDAAYETVREDFWCEAIATAARFGLGEIVCEGRSGGWLVFTDGRDPQDGRTFSDDGQYDEGFTAATDAVIDVWLAAYRSMTEWTDAYLAAAPARVAALAQSLAMDEKGGPR